MFAKDLKKQYNRKILKKIYSINNRGKQNENAITSYYCRCGVAAAGLGEGADSIFPAG